MQDLEHDTEAITHHLGEMFGMAYHTTPAALPPQLAMLMDRLKGLETRRKDSVTELV